MAGKRKNIIKGDFALPRKRGSGNNSRMLDCVSLGVKPYYVEQIDGKWPPYAEITATRVINRDPTMRDDKRSLKIAERLASRPMIYPNQPGMAYCGGECAAWKPIDDFPPRKRYRADGTEYVTTQPWCRSCTNRHAKRMYWLQREGYSKAA